MRAGKSILCSFETTSSKSTLVEWLISHKGADPNEVDQLTGLTVRELCQQLGRLDCVELLDSLMR